MHLCTYRMANGIYTKREHTLHWQYSNINHYHMLLCVGVRASTMDLGLWIESVNLHFVGCNLLGNYDGIPITVRCHTGSSHEHGQYCWHASEYNLQLVELPLQDIATSSEWTQSCAPIVLCEQLRMVVSKELQFTSSNQI